MDEENNGWFFIILVILSVWFWMDHHKLTEQITSLQDDVYEHANALDQANSNIEDAQSYAWSSYEDMGYALDNLETVYP
jgi:hypothetical protein